MNQRRHFFVSLLPTYLKNNKNIHALVPGETENVIYWWMEWYFRVFSVFNFIAKGWFQGPMYQVLLTCIESLSFLWKIVKNCLVKHHDSCWRNWKCEIKLVNSIPRCAIKLSLFTNILAVTQLLGASGIKNALTNKCSCYLLRDLRC